MAANVASKQPLGIRQARTYMLPASKNSIAEQHYHRAVELDACGQDDDARRYFLAALAAEPDHAATLNGLGALLYRTGYHSAACTTYRWAVACHPGQAVGHVNLANVLREAGDLAAARRHYEIALDLAPDFPEAHQGLGNVLADVGDVPNSLRHWTLGYRDHAVNDWPYRGSRSPIRVLMLVSVAHGNVPARIFLDDRLFAITTLAMEFYTPTLKLPPHDLILNAVGDADLCGPALAATESLLSRTSAPVINHPGHVMQTGRARNAERLQGISGVVVPRCRLLEREPLGGPDGGRVLASHGFGWPVLLRAPGFHTGRYFVRVDSPNGLATAIATLPGPTALAIEYLDATGNDGRCRKGRVLIVDRHLYPLHWAISRDWKVHYFTAEMADSESHRAEEARFLSNMPAFLGQRAMDALSAIAERLGLDYGGIDFALRADGQIIVFEANATMAIVPPSGEALWDYRRPAIDQALLAAKHMVAARGQPADVPAE